MMPATTPITMMATAIGLPRASGDFEGGRVSRRLSYRGRVLPEIMEQFA